MTISRIERRGFVSFPAFTGERIYMREFTKRDGLPTDLSRWQPTVDAMLEGVEAPGSIYLMVDQSEVKASAAHRRPGVHVDGRWNPSLYKHGHGGGGGHRFGGIPEALLLASDVCGCRAHVGHYEGEPGGGGDCGHIRVGGLTPVPMEPGRVWAGDALTMLHEAVPVGRDCLRTVVRLNVPGWLPLNV